MDVVDEVVKNYHVKDQVDIHTVEYLRRDVQWLKWIEVEANKLIRQNPGKGVDFIEFLFRKKFKNEISVKISEAHYGFDEFAGL